ncbi:MAG: hypothetical protein Q7J76_04115 [Candidatus Brocadiaceae bacterium]|uniref:hypothetical protein n=1 Tax=Candidatus Wunengus sp. YC61 TaxID=3367698 RepID=UPI00271F980F|nr:hypothetical protein [Candidatus Brocadiaceae bacterium]
MKKFNFSVSQKALIGIIIGLLPIIITFFFVYYKNRTFLKNRILDTVTVIAEAFEGQVYQFPEMTKRRVQDFTSDSLIRGRIHSGIHGKKITVDTLSRHLVRNKLVLDKTIKTSSVLSTGWTCGSFHKQQ